VKLDGGDLVIAPCVPPSFDRYEVDYHHGSSSYRIVVENPDGVSTGVRALRLDGVPLDVRRGARLRLEDDGRAHDVLVTLGGASASRSEGISGRGEEEAVARSDATGTSP
jgi:cyclic beta-1,2-glucan synthetase